MRAVPYPYEGLMADEITRKGTVCGMTRHVYFGDGAESANSASPAAPRVFVSSELTAWLANLAVFVGGEQTPDSGMIATNSSLYGGSCPTCFNVNTFTGAFVSAYSATDSVWQSTSSVAQQAVFYNAEVARSQRAEAVTEPTFLDQSEQIILELGRLQSGWDGQDGLPPSVETIRTLARTLAALPPDAPPPEAEVDGSDGSVSLRWYSNDAGAALAVSTLEDRLVVTVTSRDRELFGRVFLREDIAHLPRALLERFEQLRHG